MLVPREMKLEHSGGVKEMTDEQIVDAIEAIEGYLARRRGEAAKVIEGTASADWCSDATSREMTARCHCRCCH